jgi:hypothetical protein
MKVTVLVSGKFHIFHIFHWEVRFWKHFIRPIAKVRVEVSLTKPWK